MRISFFHEFTLAPTEANHVTNEDVDEKNMDDAILEEDQKEESSLISTKSGGIHEVQSRSVVEPAKVFNFNRFFLIIRDSFHVNVVVDKKNFNTFEMSLPSDSTHF